MSSVSKPQTDFTLETKKCFVHRQNSSTSTFKVLVVDDDQFISSLVEECLITLGLNVVKRRHTEPFSQTLDQNIALIIADVNLRRDREADVLTRLKTEYPGVPVLAISAQFWATVESAVDLARRLNVESVLAKPFSYDAFSTTVRSILSNYE